MRFLFAILSALMLAGPGSAQDVPESIFRDYAHMRQVLDDNIMRRDIVTTMRAFGASDEMTDEELAALQRRVEGIFPRDFENVDVLRINDMGNGWRQEIYAYWVGTSYLYAYLFMHDQGDRMVAVHFQFNTDFAELNGNF